MRIIHCSRYEEPRDVLDQLILAWERNDRPLLEASLAPGARAALNSLLAGTTWVGLRGELWPDRSGGGVALGYRFDISGRWSEPEETLEEDRAYGDAALSSANPDLDTLLKPSALTKSDPLCSAQHNGSYVEFRIMLSSSGEPAQSGRFVVNCPT